MSLLIFMWFWLGNPFLVLFSWLKVIFKVEKSISRSSEQKYHFLTNKARNMCNTSFLCNIDWAIPIGNNFAYSRSLFKGVFYDSMNFLTELPACPVTLNTISMACARECLLGCLGGGRSESMSYFYQQKVAIAYSIKLHIDFYIKFSY